MFSLPIHNTDARTTQQPCNSIQNDLSSNQSIMVFNMSANMTATSTPTSDSSGCVLRMSELHSPVTVIYSILSMFGGLGAAVGNLFVIIIIWTPKQRTQSHKILTSLAISDMLVGTVLFPLFSVQLLSPNNLLHNCFYDYTREYITTVTIGSSLMVLGDVAYDRYILMTKYAKYKYIMSPKKVAVLIAMSWGMPAVSPSLRFLGKGPFLYCVIAITLGPLIILLLTYYKIVKCIQESSARIRSHTVIPLHKINKITTTAATSITRKIVTTSIKQPATNNNNHNGKDYLSSCTVKRKKTIQSISVKRSERRNIKLAKTVSVLILVYCVCLVPSSIWSVCDIIQMSGPFTRTEVIQNLYIFACFAGSMNSFFNPVIYFFKQPDMRKGLKKLLGFAPNKTKITNANGSSCGANDGSSNSPFNTSDET